MFSAMFSASLRGFEPPAYRLGGGRSIQLSYSDNYKTYLLVAVMIRRHPFIILHHFSIVKPKLLYFFSISYNSVIKAIRSATVTSQAAIRQKPPTPHDDSR